MFLTEIYNNHEISFINTTKETLVSARDLVAMLGYDNPKTAWMSLKPTVEQFSGAVQKLDRFYKKLNRSYETDYLNNDQVLVLMMKSNRPETYPFMQWVLKTLNKEIQSYSIVGTEEDLANQLTFLTSLSRLNFTFECSVEDTIAAPHSSGLNRTKRYDFVRRLPNVTQIYELKKGELTAAHVYQTLLVKHYMELGSTVGAKRVDFVFIAESISDEAVAAIKMFRCEYKYDNFDHNGFTFKGRIRFVSLNEFATDIYNGIIDHTPKSGVWYIHQHILRYTPSLFNDLQIQGFKKSVFKEPKRLQLMEAA